MLNIKKQEYIDELNQRVEDKILNKANAEFLAKLISKADSLEEVQAIMAMGTTYKRTGFHFDFRKEPACSNIKYLKKNDKLSFVTDKDALTHKLIIGDNYDALRQLLITHRGLVDVIYIDPPYGKDSMGNFADTNYTNAITRDNLLSMLYVRLQLAKDLLSENGIIFCSIDDRNIAYVRCIFDEVFGESNFISNLIWKCRSSMQYSEPLISSQTEYVLAFAKNKKHLRDTNYCFTKIKKKTDTLSYSNPDNDPRGPWNSSGIIRDDGRKKYTVVSPTGIEYTEAWLYTEENFKQLEEDKRIWWGKNGTAQPRKKNYLSDFEGNPSSNILMDEFMYSENGDTLIKEKVFEIGTTEKGSNDVKSIFDSKKSPFDYPKPVSLIKYLISLIPNKDALVLDFFAGSGTTGQSVLQLNKEDGGNRKFIICTNNEETGLNPNGIAYDVTAKRLKRIMSGVCYDDSSNFKWLEKNEPYGNNLEVTEIAEISPTVSEKDNTPFDVIDESLYDILPFENKEDKINWVCTYFKNTMKKVEKDTEYCGRWGE